MSAVTLHKQGTSIFRLVAKSFSIDCPGKFRKVELTVEQAISEIQKRYQQAKFNKTKDDVNAYVKANYWLFEVEDQTDVDEFELLGYADSVHAMRWAEKLGKDPVKVMRKIMSSDRTREHFMSYVEEVF